MARIHHSRAFAIVMALLIGWPSTASAQSSMDLQITVSSSESDTRTLDLAALDAMEQATFTTTTIWTDGAVTFSGVPLKSVLKYCSRPLKWMAFMIAIPALTLRQSAIPA